MSLQSMTSLGRIGRILSGASESHPNIRESAPAQAQVSREPSTLSEEAILPDRNQTVLAMAEPDVIASTKANSLKHLGSGGSAIVAMCGAEPRPASVASGPVAPPRRKKRNKLHGSQSLSTTDGDNLSICTNDTDDYRLMTSARKPERPEKPPPLDALLTENPLSSSLSQSQSAALPSPASTIESLTREFQDSLELSNSKYEKSSTMSSNRSTRHSTERSAASSRSSTGKSVRGQPLDVNEPPTGAHVVRPADDDRLRSGGSRTQSESRALPTTGHSSLGSNGRRSACESGGPRRRSCGDESALAQALRGSPPRLTDTEILEQVTVLNLDTGERMPLSVAEHKLPQCINPLSLHIMRLTSEYIGRPNDDENTSPIVKPKTPWTQIRVRMRLGNLNRLRKSQSTTLTATDSDISLDIQNMETDEESESVCAGGAEDEAKEAKRESADRQTTAIKRKTEKLKRFFGTTVKKTVDAAKSLAQEVSHARHKEDVADIADDVRGEHNIKLKASNSHKGPYDFDGCVRHVQEMGSGHSGAVWCCKFSVCGRLLATAGQDKLLRVWVTRDAHHMFQDMRTKYNAEQKSSPTPSQESLASLAAPPPAPDVPPAGPSAPFVPTPFCVYSGHTSDLLDVSWSKNYFILSSSMDKTVRLWHISRGECLCCFQHIDFVTAIVFHPRDDRYFLSGSLDGKLRLWNIPDKKVAVWNEVDGKTKLITAANFCQNGKFAVVGTYDGRCIFYTTDQLKYHTQIDVRSTRGKNSTGRKISGVEPMPNEDKILVTSNDSRIRLYDLRDLNLSCKYKGYVNVSSQIKASFSHDGKYIVSGSENQCIYIWKTYHDYSKFTSVRRDRNDFWEGIKAHNAVVTCAVFAPNPDYMIRMINEREEEAKAKDGTEKDEVKGAEGGMVASSQTGHVLVSADFNGCIKVFVHKAKPKHSSLPASALA
ncbi:WD repeat-containing protein 44 isoform X1 [Plutella xylostella]|uniref:WD repeat-containing protein 44 isoform X1 n=1 Tax=Plutella xylostella TaxID=51655 RepID=UPI002032652E|nr:WD repeat-containing protein 44 isoform X1 [Plutella xylostella]